jgi:hypothetical protein
MFKIIDKKLLKKNFETSVLVPIRRDIRVYKMLDCLSRQKYANFVLLISNDSKEPFLKKSDFPKNLSYIYYHDEDEKMMSYEKLNFLISQVKTEIAAILDSDAEPYDGWLEDLVPLAKKEKAVIKGREAEPIGWCAANLVFKTEILKENKFDEKLLVCADSELGMRLEKKGYKLIIPDKGWVYHNMISSGIRLSRVIPPAKDDIYIALKYRSTKFLIRKIFRNAYNVFHNGAQLGIYIVAWPYVALRNLILGNKKP